MPFFEVNYSYVELPKFSFERLAAVVQQHAYSMAASQQFTTQHTQLAFRAANEHGAHKEHDFHAAKPLDYRNDQMVKRLGGAQLYLRRGRQSGHRRATW
jgi:hypothetical protein